MNNKTNNDIHLASRIRRTLRWLVLRSKALARNRSLIGEILALQVVLAAFVGALALTGIWLASTWVIEDNMQAWGEQWLDNLDELGVPLYLSDHGDKYERVESYVDKFAEIAFVRYYSESGEPIFTQARASAAPAIAPLEAGILERIATRPVRDQRYLVETLHEVPIVRISKPISAHSVSTDGLLGFDPDVSIVDEKTIGYVELGLDFSSHQTYLVRTILTAVLIVAVVLVSLTVASWLVYRRALRPLSDLQSPLRKRTGAADFNLTKSAHREITAIANALNNTTSALEQRDKKLSELANYDELTGLVNRKRVTELLEREMQLSADTARTSALLFIDLDQFKYVNDCVSHSGGDRFLKLAADRLVGGVRPEDTVARFGGDEFIVLLRGVDKKQAETMSGALVRRMQDEPFAAAGRSLSIRCSIGLTMIRGTRIKQDKLLSQADTACHYAKANGRNRFHVYKSSSKEVSEMTADADWAQRIQTALKHDAFVLHYQPIVDIRTRETRYYEVLARMLDHRGQLVAPALFLPAAERFGLMEDIDRWVIRRSLQNLAKMRAAHRDVRFTLNASGSTFERADFFDFILEHLQASDLPLDAIVIEITEQAAIHNLHAAATRMADLVKRGLRFAIDDFGSGYCSYGYLRQLPVAFVKIDGSFIANLTKDPVDQKILTAIRQVAEAAGCETIAEHVTDNETLLLLDELGVDYAQGYFLGRPSAEINNPLPLVSSQPRRRRGPIAEPQRAAARREVRRVAAVGS